MKVKSESEVAQSCPTLGDPMDCNLPGFSIHGIFQARVLEWGAIAFSVSTVGEWLNFGIATQSRQNDIEGENKIHFFKKIATIQNYSRGK